MRTSQPPGGCRHHVPWHPPHPKPQQGVILAGRGCQVGRPSQISFLKTYIWKEVSHETPSHQTNEGSTHRKVSKPGGHTQKLEKTKQPIAAGGRCQDSALCLVLSFSLLRGSFPGAVLRTFTHLSLPPSLPPPPQASGSLRPTFTELPNCCQMINKGFMTHPASTLGIAAPLTHTPSGPCSPRLPTGKDHCLLPL